MHGLVFTEIRRLEMSSTGLMIPHKRVSFLLGQVGNRVMYKRNVSTCMQACTEWGSGMTRNAVFLTHKRVKPQLLSARKGSCGPEATTVYLGYCTRRLLLFSVYMDVTARSRYVISIDNWVWDCIFMCIYFDFQPFTQCDLISYCPSVLYWPSQWSSKGFLLTQKSPSFFSIFHILDFRDEFWEKVMNFNFILFSYIQLQELLSLAATSRTNRGVLHIVTHQGIVPLFNFMPEFSDVDRHILLMLLDPLNK